MNYEAYQTRSGTVAPAMKDHFLDNVLEYVKREDLEMFYFHNIISYHPHIFLCPISY